MKVVKTLLMGIVAVVAAFAYLAEGFLPLALALTTGMLVIAWRTGNNIMPTKIRPDLENAVTKFLTNYLGRGKERNGLGYPHFWELASKIVPAGKVSLKYRLGGRREIINKFLWAARLCRNEEELGELAKELGLA